MIRQLIFDLDGTLVDSCDICVRILSGMLADRGSEHRIDVTYARPWMSVGGEEMVAALLGPACGDPRDEIVEFRKRYAETETSSDALFAGVADGLALLEGAGFTLSICSNKPQELCDKVLAETGIAGHFSAVVGSRPGLPKKPRPDMLATTLNALGAVPGECLFIGDSEVDHQIASEADMPFVFMSYGYAQPAFTHAQADSFDCFATMSRAIATRIAPAHAA